MRRVITALVAAALLTACVEPLPTPGPEEGKDTTDTPAAPVPEREYDYYMYGIADIDIITDGKKPVVSKEVDDYLPCTVNVDGNKVFPDFEGRGKIRGRGNSTWEWYRKKPYRIKLDEKSEFMGMASNSDWVLLADYRDVTHMMNNVGFTLAHELGIPYTNHSRYATVTLNGKFLGLYMVTEQVEKGSNRVDVEGEGGLLLGLDVNDGPDDCPEATDNFHSDVYHTDVCVKYPSDPTPEQLEYARKEFARLENTIKGKKWSEITAILNVQSMIDYIMIQEIICNVEMNNGDSMRSGYINRKADSLWVMGPVWDCDGGFCYNWGDMYDNWGWGHTYFEDYRRLIFGSDPYHQKGAYGRFPGYISDLFGCPEFVEAFKERWSGNRDSLLEKSLSQIDDTYQVIEEAIAEDSNLWGFNRNYPPQAQVSSLKKWLRNRFTYLDKTIKSYPTPAE